MSFSDDPIYVPPFPSPKLTSWLTTSGVASAGVDDDDEPGANSHFLRSTVDRSNLSSANSTPRNVGVDGTTNRSEAGATRRGDGNMGGS